MNRALRASLLVAAVVISASGCGGSDSGSPAVTTAEDSPESVQKQQYAIPPGIDYSILNRKFTCTDIANAYAEQYMQQQGYSQDTDNPYKKTTDYELAYIAKNNPELFGDVSRIQTIGKLIGDYCGEPEYVSDSLGKAIHASIVAYKSVNPQ